MISNLMRKRKTKINTLQLKIDSLEAELLDLHRTLKNRDEKIFSLFDIKQELENKNKELLKENESLRVRSKKWK